MKYATSALFTAAMILAALASSTSAAAETIDLKEAAIVVAPDEASFVQYGVEELAGYLRDITGTAPPVAASPDAKSKIVIVVGSSAAKQFASQEITDGTFGDEGYVLRSATYQEKPCLVVTGATSRGTKQALAALMRGIRAEKGSAIVDALPDGVQRPAAPKRGLHFNGWAFNNPYSFRSWTEEQWKQYLDIMAYQGVNLFYLWPFIEIIPMPLSAEDKAYLEECQRVVDYAQKKHGMEVWIMQCTNRVARDNCGVADPRSRPYWRPAQEDLNPGNPEHFRAIVASREAMYKIINNVDGICNIDSDPGYYPGSSLEEYVNVLKACRELLDKHNVHGKQTKIISWMWEGWGLVPGQIGTKSRDQHELDTIEALRKGLPEPWGLVSGRGGDLKLCKQADVLNRTVFLPYGAIEGEPAYPNTNLSIDPIRDLFKKFVAPYPDMAGVMGNLQTPLLQFPNMYYYTSSMNDVASRARSEQEVLQALAGYLYPEQSQLIADSYLALKAPNPSEIQRTAEALSKAIREEKLGRPGLFGRKLFPRPSIVAESLSLQLNYYAARGRLTRGVDAAKSTAEIQKLVGDYFDAYLAWDTAHGWHGLWGYDTWPLGNHATEKWFADVARSIAKTLRTKDEIEACFAALSTPLNAKYEKAAVEVGCIGQFKRGVLAAMPIDSLAQKAKATASVTPDAKRYPAESAIDGQIATLYWPGALVNNNQEWLQLTWDKPQTIHRLTARFLQHPSMAGRTIHLQREVSPDTWQDFATTLMPRDERAPHAVATFELAEPVTLDKLRIVNLLDLFEVEAY